MSSVLAIHRYYWPDTPPYAAMLRSIVAEWTQAGHAVDVLTSQPSYKPEAQIASRPPVERLDGVTVRRIAMKPDRSARWRRPFNVLWFPLVVALRVLAGRRYDVVMCSTAPPVLLGWAVSFVARMRGAKFIYHCMDLHPEIGRLSGDFANPRAFALLSRLELAACRRAAAIIVLSEDMRRAVLARDPGLAERTVVLTNFELPDHATGAQPEPSPLPVADGKLRIVFTGNVGRFQGLEAITQAVLDPSPDLDDLEIVFMGEGAAKRDLEHLVADADPRVRSRVVFVPHGSLASVKALLATADLGLVSLSPEVIRYAYPSKTATYLGAGLPVLVAVEPDSSLARSIEEAGVGGLLPVDTPASTVRCLQSWVARRHELASMSDRAQALWEKEYAGHNLLPRWNALLAQVTSGTGAVSGGDR